MKIILCKIEKEEIEIKYDNIIAIENKQNIHSTFFGEIKGRKFNKFFSNEALDLYYISLFVFIADRLIKREDFPDCWTRKIKLLIPVIEKDKWEYQKDNLEKILSFLSGDLWEIEFRKRNLSSNEEKLKKKIEKEKKQDIDFRKITMFSGGLDSYIGAIDFLESEKDILFISHYGGGKGVKEYQDQLQKKLCEYYNITSQNFLQFHVKAINGKEDTTRTRSLMFFTHAILLASTIPEKIKIFIPENGLISLNIPLTAARSGSSSTRTTHPYYLKKLQNLINNLGINIELINPYQFKTKGEMILECKNMNLLKETITNTMSCSHPDQGRYIGKGITEHCGYCLPCIIRRASIKKGLEIDRTSYFDKDFKKGNTAIYNLTAYKLGVEKLKQSKLKIKFIIQKSGPLAENLDDFEQLYVRGMKELENVLEEYR